jgi:CBS domain-containing protein
VRLHYSWFVVPSLITLSLTSQFAALNRSWSPAIIWGLAALTAALFFVCIVLHELAHASVARLSGIPVRGITLFARGGIAQIEKELRSIVWAITHNCATVDATTMVRQFVDDQLMRMATRCFAVTQDGRVVGLITPEDVKHVERERWDRTRVSEAMRPLQSLHPVRPDASAGDALEQMGREHVNQLPVVFDGRLEGVVTRSYLVHLWHVRRELMA